MFPASWTPSEIAASIRSAGAARECIKRVLCPSKKNSQTTPDSEANHPNGLTTHKHSKTWRLGDGPGTPRGSRANRHYDHVRHRQRCQSDEQNLKQPIVEHGRGIAHQQYDGDKHRHERGPSNEGPPFRATECFPLHGKSFAQMTRAMQKTEVHSEEHQWRCGQRERRGHHEFHALVQTRTTRNGGRAEQAYEQEWP